MHSMNEVLTRSFFLPLHEHLRGRETLRHYQELRRNDGFSIRALEDLQLAKLRLLLLHAITNVPWYRQTLGSLGVDDAKAMTLESFSQIPVIRKLELRSNLDAFRAETYRDSLVKYSTGGSTGDPLVFYTDRIKEARHKAHDWRCRAWFGVHPGDRQVDLWGSPIELERHTHIRRWKDRYLLNHVVLSAFDLQADTLRRYVSCLQTYRPRLVYGYPSILTVLAQFMLEQRLHLEVAPRVVSCTSEMLYPLQRDTIREAFGCPVVNEYGSRDGGLIAHECPAERMHIASEHVLVEVHQPDADGVGKLLVTNLDGFGMPFIRYEIGDVGALDQSRCVCGRPQPLLRELRGRSNDFVIGANGVRVHSLGPIYALRPYRRKIRQFKVIQHSDLSLEIWLSCVLPFDAVELEHIRREMRKLLRLDVPIEFAFMDLIEPERSGKHRAVVCEAAPLAP